MVTPSSKKPMPTAVVVLPSTTYRAADFVRAAEALGVDLVVVSEQAPPFDMGDRYLRIDCSDPDSAAAEVVALGDRAPIDGVVAADDSGVVIAALATSKLGLPGNDPGAARATRDKGRLRQLLAEGEVPQPDFLVIRPGEEAREAADTIGYPLVVKPLDRAASQGVIRVDSPDRLETTMDRVRGIVGGAAELMLEGYMPGLEVALEGLMIDSKLTALAVFDKPDTPEGPFFPETLLITPSRLDPHVLTEVERVAAAAVRAVGLSHGPVHVEMKVDGDQVGVIELAARSIGGLCSRSLSFGLLGTSLEALILRNALGLDKPELRRHPVASGVLMIPVTRSGRLLRVDGLDEVRRIQHVTGVDITAPHGAMLLAPPEGDRYLGFVFARADTPDQVEEALREAMSRIVVATQ